MDAIKVNAIGRIGKALTLHAHDESACDGSCVVHNPSDHHMCDWPLVWRGDKRRIMERICPHGIGHPDPDSLAYENSLNSMYDGVHSCDGCCCE